MRFCSANCQFDGNPVRSRAIHCPLLICGRAINRPTTNRPSSSKVKLWQVP